MIDRKLNTWEVQIQSSEGDVTTEKVNAYWDPGYDLTEEGVVEAAASQVRWRNFRNGGKGASKVAYAVVGVPVLTTA